MKRLIFSALLAVLIFPAASALAFDTGPGETYYGVLMADSGRGGGELDRKWESLSPDEKQRLLDMYERRQGRAGRREERRKAYEQMTPEEKQEFRGRMERFRDMSPEEQDRMMRRMERIREMTPEEWDAYKQKAERFRALPEGKRDEIRKRLDEIDRLPQEERRKKREELRQELIEEGIIQPGQRRGGRGR